jgi:hypothetical protein
MTGFLDIPEFDPASNLRWLIFGAIVVLAILISLIVPRIVHPLFQRRLRGSLSSDEEHHLRAKRAETVENATRSLIRYALIVGVILSIFVVLFPSRGSTVFGVTVLVAVLGFAAQSILRDIIAGIAMLFERWFDVGDTITVEPWGLSGVVESITLRSVRLRGLSGETVRVHNQFMYGVRIARRGIRVLAVEIFVADRERGQELVRQLAEIVPMGPMHLIAPLHIIEEEQLGTLTRIVVRAVVAPGREWLIESFAVDVLKELDHEDPPVIRHGPVAYFDDRVAEQRFSRAVAPLLERSND